MVVRLTAAEPPSPVEELRVVVQKLAAENAQLKNDAHQRETLIRMLTENLAIAHTESELFRKKWAEAQLRAQTLGVNFGDNDATRAQRQLLESIRALYLAEAERQRLTEQLQRLLAAAQGNGDLGAEMARAREVLGASAPSPAGERLGGPKPAESTLTAARVLDVHPQLRLAVLDVGLLQGARVGMPLIVVRSDRVVAELRIVEVRQRICGALIETVEKGVRLAAGDVAQVTKS